MLRVLSLVLAAACVLAAPGARARGLDTLGVLERQAVEDALATRGLVIDPLPEGKRIGTIHVVNHEVFSSRDGYFALLNIFHRTTREPIIRREVLQQTGDLYSQPLVEETVRNLRDGDLSSLVAILPVRSPVQSPQPGQVDLLVVTRDVWSLRFNTEFDAGEGTLRSLSTSLSENNLFGWRKRFSFAFNLGRGAYSVGPTYVDPNIAGTRLSFSGSYRSIYSRELGHPIPVAVGGPGSAQAESSDGWGLTSRREGYLVSGRLTYPLFSLASRWGASLAASYSNAIARSFLGNDLRLVDLRGTTARESLPYAYRLRSSSIDSQVVRQLGRKVMHKIALGHSLSSVRPTFLEGWPPLDAGERASFAAQVFPRSERLSSVYLSYVLFTPRYRVYRDLTTFDLGEDILLGPSVSAAVSRAAAFLGSENVYTGLSASAGWTFDLGDGLQKISFGWSGAVRDGELVDQNRGASIFLATPVLRKLVRLVGEAGVSVLVDNTRPNVYYTVGAESGLRGYATGEFLGQASWIGHLEARSAPLPLWALRFGLVAFYDVGHAANRFVDLGARHDAGLGLRLLIPQLNFYVLRIDWAIPFQNGERAPNGQLFTTAGFPGRISAGFRQVF
jgi:hypothetical protein